MEIIENLNRRYLRIPLEKENETGMEGYRSRVLQRNKLENLLKADKRYIDGVAYLYYEITGMGNLTEVWSGSKTTVNRMNMFVDGLEKVLQELQEYLLSQEDICLCPEYIMMDVRGEKIFFLYIPHYEGEQMQDLEHFLEFMIDSMDFDDEEGMERLYSFYNEVMQNGGRVRLWDLVHLWKKEEQFFKYKETEKNIEASDICMVEEQGDCFEDYECEKWIGRGKIYSVPYHGIKMTQTKDEPLT